jgi:hypothetical protein
MKYEIYNNYTDSVVGFAASLEEAKDVATFVDAMCQESDEWVEWCEIREIPE